MRERLLEALPDTRRKVLLTGWFSFLHGEVTAGDVLALERVRYVLKCAGIAHDVAWSPGFRPDALHLEDVRPEDYSHLVFVCGPVHGWQIEELHQRFARCVRIAVGTSVVTPGSLAVTGFHRVLARDAVDAEPGRDLAARAPVLPSRPVVGVVLTHGQQEYGRQRRHEQVAEQVTHWLARQDCARLELDTRLDTHDWRLCATPAQLESVLTRLDLVVTDRLHGLVLALRAGVPALAVDPVEGGAKVTAQARACDWPALVSAERLDGRELGRWWHWCLTTGRMTARQIAAEFREGVVRDGADRLVEVLRTSFADRTG
ncbi:polysaccharide pyruvyl transferase family protein [Streptomyces ipomoeae]|uniref:polysaccharide pyruvyl transferase family protein n=1 Tax=Streptomyces ipomoeae TaxID=103232 RepID=UPI0011470B0E|nr:polysaccharide pyruvyl transferase family protein [Streptomyces ipomoeae]MDX2936061.1 polysaccharide pyruvyl transferase family protein [Streptomyces ipomoeae]TQE31142.1 polysaccharide pyruvyl transferase family protein [Streptomyces ipomoeae]